MNKKSAAGFTLVELLVVIAIIGVMVAMAIPAVQASREMGRRAICQANVGQILLGIQSYENAFETLPPGVVNPDGPIRNEAVGLHQGWLIQMLPYVDLQTAYQLIDFSKCVYDPANARVREISPPNFICPSEPNDAKAASSYAGCHHDVEAPIAADNNGVLFLNSRIGRRDIPDGASYTIFMGEKRVEFRDLGWMSGTRATLRNTGRRLNAPESQAAADSVGLGPPKPADEAAATAALLFVGGFASPHVNGAYMGFGDASARFISEDIDLTLWQRMGHRADGKLLDGQPDE